jgi:hypothetical protein
LLISFGFPYYPERPGLINRTPYFQGYAAYIDSRINFTQAENWAMGRTISPGDVIMWVEIPFENLRIGDLVYYENPLKPGQSLAHRVIETNGRTLRTKGDESPDPDPYEVTPERLKGMVIGVIYFREP